MSSANGDPGPAAVLRSARRLGSTGRVRESQGRNVVRPARRPTARTSRATLCGGGWANDRGRGGSQHVPWPTASARTSGRLAAAAKCSMRSLLDVGPNVCAEPSRWPLPDRFGARALHVDREGATCARRERHWVSGCQSAALALKAAGASTVTVVCFGRWLNAEYSEEHRSLIEFAEGALQCFELPCHGRQWVSVADARVAIC
jgi:hypothetical protein